MNINKNLEQTQNFIRNDKVGFIGNYLTMNIIKNFFEVTEIPYDNHLTFINEEELTTIIIEKDIYETDHQWSEYDSDSIKELLIASNKKVLLLDFFNNNPANVSKSDIFINSSIKYPFVENEILNLPFVFNEEEFNPSYSDSKNKVLLFHLNEVEISSNILPILKKHDVSIANPEYISRKFIQTLFKTLKHTQVLFMIDKDLNVSLRKGIEIIATLQDTLVIVEPNDIQPYEYSLIADSDDQAVNYLRFVFNNDDYVKKLKVKNEREAFLRYSKLSLNETKPEIGVITVSMREEKLVKLFKDIGEQQHVSLQVVLLTHGFKLSSDKINELSRLGKCKLTVLHKELSISLGECLNECLKFIETDYVIKMDDDDFYFSNFLIDLYIAQNYSKAEIVGKFGFFFYLKGLNLVGKRRTEKQFINISEVKGNTIFSRTSILKKYKFSDLKRHEDSDLFERIRNDKGKIFCIHPFDMCVYRDSNKFNHSYQVEDTNFLRDAHTIYFGQPNETISSE